jgi:hypothetical protein
LLGVRGWCRGAVLAVALALVGSSCGQAVNGDGSSPAGTTGGESIPTIETTFPDAGEKMVFPMKSFDGMNQVATNSFPDPADLPFNAVFPQSAKTPMGVFVSIPDDYPKGEEEVVAEYDGASPYGAFRLREEKTPPGLVDQSFIEEIPKVCDTCTDARLVDIGSGIQGALLAGPDGPTSVTWLQGVYKMIVIGPPTDTFTTDAAIALAKEVAADFTPS